MSTLALGTMTFGAESDEVADRCGVSMAQVALAWLRDRPAVSSVILGARTTEQLDKASGPNAADYPYGGPGREQRSRKIEGGR